MIKVTITRNDNNKITAFEMSGHADFAKKGQDIVCAGASAVSFGTVNAIIVLCDTMPEIEQGSDGGYLRCVFPTNVDSSTFEKIQLLLEGMVVSLETIERDYGKYIKIYTK
ncbi:ribosomal-processing cysteine protease Prp [Bacillus songklensis]|uniref:Ribosomal processing cysteine protease Prp n=1 Tax=Bacillus songklensis TaxID=1069116 RepID=A0ABV8B1F2_9BACI